MAHDPLLFAVQDLAAKAMTGFTDWSSLGHINVVRQDKRLLFNYTHAAQYANEWNVYELVSRGLVLDTDGNIVARPFDKFFNWNERGRRGSGHIVTITEKIDGALGILYRYGGANAFHMHTRGQFNTKQAGWGTEWLLAHNVQFRKLPVGYTALVEIVGPASENIVRYAEDRHGVYLLALRHTQSGIYLPYYDTLMVAAEAHFPMPLTYTFNNVEAILAAAGTLSAEYEGWVVEMSDSSRWKIKGDSYVELHRAAQTISRKHIKTALQNGYFNHLLDSLPAIKKSYVLALRDEITAACANKMDEIKHRFHTLPKENRALFAAAVKAECPHLARYLFAMLDGKDVGSMVWRDL